jgi:hypothetical protein
MQGSDRVARARGTAWALRPRKPEVVDWVRLAQIDTAGTSGAAHAWWRQALHGQLGEYAGQQVICKVPHTVCTLVPKELMRLLSSPTCACSPVVLVESSPIVPVMTST